MKRNRIAILVGVDGRPGGSIRSGGQIRIESVVPGDTRTPELLDLRPEPDERALGELLAAPAITDVAVLWCSESTPRERIVAGDAGVLLLRARASIDRIREVSLRYLDFDVGRYGDFLAPVEIGVFDERWDVPAGLSMLLCLELLGGVLDRSVLCFASDCSRCEAIVRGVGDPVPRRHRTCRMPAREGVLVVDPGFSCRWPAR